LRLRRPCLGSFLVPLHHPGRPRSGRFRHRCSAEPGRETRDAFQPL